MPPYDPLIGRLIAAFPACFSRLDRKPLKIGLGQELLALAGVHPALADLTRTQLRRALRVYTGAPTGVIQSDADPLSYRLTD